MQNDRWRVSIAATCITGYRWPAYLFTPGPHEVPIEETTRDASVPSCEAHDQPERNDVPTNTVPSRRHGTNWQADEKLQLVVGGIVEERGSKPAQL